MKEIDFHKHCPYCKTLLKTKSECLLVCSKCEHELYLSPRPCVTAMILKNGKLLFTKRAREPFAGKWDTPGGFVDYDDNLESALKRELKEELGVETKIKRYLTSKKGSYHWQGVELKVVAVFFECEIIGEPHAMDDVLEVAWHKPEDYRMLCFESDREVVKKFFLN